MVKPKPFRMSVSFDPDALKALTETRALLEKRLKRPVNLVEVVKKAVHELHASEQDVAE